MMLMGLTVVVLIASVQAQTTFTVQPVSVVQAEGLEAVFECLYPGASHDWFINGTEHLINTEGIVATVPSVNSPVAKLRITARPEYNNAVVQCRALVEVEVDTFMVLRSNITTLTVYGVDVIGVENMTKISTISWVDQPFTTSITYCVDVTQTFGSTETSVLVSSECGLTETVYTFTSPGHGPCDTFNFTVTPTDGVDNGTSSEPTIGYFTQATGEVNNTIVSADPNPQMKEVTVETMVPSCYSPSSYRIDSVQLNTSVSSFEVSNISFSLPTDLRTFFSLTLTDGQGVELLFVNIQISTFDIQDMTANNCSLPNSINVSVFYAVRSTSPGALIIIVPMNDNDSLDYTNAVFRFLSRNMSEDNLVNATAGRNKVFAFDIENNDGILRFPITTAADTEIVTDVSGGEVRPNHPTMSDTIEATKSEGGVVNVTCRDDSLIYLVLLQYSSNPDQLSVGLINGDSRSAILSPGGSGDVHLVVFSWRQGETFLNAVVSLVSQFQAPTTETPTTVTSDMTSFGSVSQSTDGSGGLLAGAVAGVVVLVVVLAILVVMAVVVMAVAWICIVRARRTQRKTFDLTQDQPRESSVPVVDGRVDWSQTFAGIEQPNEAYSLVTKKNPSYEKPSKRKRRNQCTFDIRSQPPQLASIAESTQSGRDYVNTVAQVSEDCCQYENVLPQDGVPNATYVNVQ